MWQNFSRKFVERKAWMALTLPAWVFGSFVLVQVVVYFLLLGLRAIELPFAGLTPAVFNAVFSAVIYLLTILIVIGLPWLVKKYKTTREELGIAKLPNWYDPLLAPAGLIIYMVLSAILILLATQFLTFIDFDQVQETGFTGLTQPFDYILAFFTLVLLAPIAEEILFRGYLFGKLRNHVPLWLAIIITSLMFAFVHGAWNVGIDVFALSIILCLLRVVSKSLWPSILLHMMKNFIAFYLLFINPTLLSTLGG